MELQIQQTIDVIEGITPKEFREKYLRPEKPVVLRGLWKSYPAFTKWSIDYFKKELGNIEVGVFDAGKNKADRSFKTADLKMKFGDYLDRITEGPCDLRLFLFNIFKYKPQLKNDFGWPPLTRGYLKRVPFMFFGGGGSVVRIHQDMDWSNGFLTQLHGRKLVVLFHPRYTKFLYRYPFNVHSSVDIENPDFEKYPGLKHVKGMQCILEPGDTLFIPSGYWHYIKYLEGGYAINLRALSPYPMRWITGLWHIAVLSPLDDLFRKMMGKKWFDFKNKATHRRASEAIMEVAG